MDNIKSALLQNGYNDRQASVAMEKLSRINDQLKAGIERWAESGIETDYTIAGVNLSKLKSEFSLTYPAALLTMDWLIREPDKALASIKRGIK